VHPTRLSNSGWRCLSFDRLYNLWVPDRILCSCVTCPTCGAWVVVQGRNPRDNNNKDRLRTTCALPECGKEFSFDEGETRVFELPVSLFERRHFYGSELRWRVANPRPLCSRIGSVVERLIQNQSFDRKHWLLWSSPAANTVMRAAHCWLELAGESMTAWNPARGTTRGLQTWRTDFVYRKAWNDALGVRFRRDVGSVHTIVRWKIEFDDEINYNAPLGQCSISA